MKKCRYFFAIVMFILILFSTTSATIVRAEVAEKKPSKSNKDDYNILVDISEFKLYLIKSDTNEPIKVYPIAGGKPETPSPYGTWVIVNKAKDWGTGFGTRWMELSVPWGKYGIHGTDKPLTISNPDSLGCIRMFNKDVEELYKYVDCGTIVVIYGGPYNLSWNKFRILEPGNRGADVMETQRSLKERGYYSGQLDGVYGENMKAHVIRFRKDNKLKTTHDIDEEMYNALGMQAFE
jgi:hypothetical protein